jgi:hypothetical protein
MISRRYRQDNPGGLPGWHGIAGIDDEIEQHIESGVDACNEIGMKRIEMINY